jgi:hypothetical protein
MGVEWAEAHVSHSQVLISEALSTPFSQGCGRAILVLEVAGRYMCDVVVAKAI